MTWSSVSLGNQLPAAHHNISTGSSWSAAGTSFIIRIRVLWFLRLAAGILHSSAEPEPLWVSGPTLQVERYRASYRVYTA